IGHRDPADIGLDRAERIIGRLRRRRLGQRVEQGGLADIRQPDDSATKAHSLSRRCDWGGAGPARRGPLDVALGDCQLSVRTMKLLLPALLLATVSAPALAVDPP